MVSGEVPEDFDPGLGQFIGDIEGRLTAKLDNDPFGLFLFIDAQDIFDRQRLKIEFVGGVVVGGNGFGVAVDHDGLKALIPEGEGGMNAAVIKLDTLADAVGAAAQNHDLASCADLDLIRGIIGGEIIGGIFYPADRHRLPGLGHPKESRLARIPFSGRSSSWAR